MAGNVLRRLDLAQQFRRVAANAAGVDFDDLDSALRIDYEGAALSKALRFDHHAEVARDLAGRIADHRVLDLADGV